MSEPLVQGEVSFVRFQRPALRAGTYRVRVEQHIEHTAGPAAFTEDFTAGAIFEIRGRRFTLDPTAIDSLFPPANHSGEFAQVLPHIVLNDRTYPWQYTAGADADAPWLALLVFDEDDPPPAVRRGQVLDLVRAAVRAGGRLPENTQSYETLAALEFGESYQDACDYIDLPATQFHALAPAPEDLVFLAHARRVHQTRKAAGEHDDVNTPAEFAVIVANRLPRAGARSTACLVSLDGFAALLPDENGAARGGLPAGVDTIRLVCLKSWSFQSVDLPETFTGLLEHVSVDVLRLPPANHAAPTEAESAASATLALGYTALPHRLRDGGYTASLYRGPLTPYPIARALRFPLASADAALRYDPDSGLFDVSYAAAYELGRLLALSSPEYVANLTAWKRTLSQANIAAAERDQVYDTFAAVVGAAAMPARGEARMALRAAKRMIETHVEALLIPPPEPEGGGGGGQPPSQEAVDRLFITILIRAVRAVLNVLARWLRAGARAVVRVLRHILPGGRSRS